MKRIWHALKAAVAPPTDIRVDDDGAWHYRRERRVDGVRWDEVMVVSAGKFDRVTYDPICLCLHDPATASLRHAFIELTPGFEELVREVERRFDVDPAWRADVNTGAFRASWRTLWRRDDAG